MYNSENSDLSKISSCVISFSVVSVVAMVMCHPKFVANFYSILEFMYSAELYC